jgi:hypothetical protein
MEGVPFVGNDACAHNLLLKGRPLIMRLQKLTGEPSRDTELQASMFNYDPPKEKELVDYTGLKIGAALLLVFFLITLQIWHWQPSSSWE